MGSLKSITSDKSQLTENQTKTIAVLCDHAKKTRSKHMQMLKMYKDFLKKRAEEPSAPPADKRKKQKKRIAGSFPVTISKDEVIFIKDIKDISGAVKLTFSKGFKSGSKLGYIDSRDQPHALGEVRVERKPEEGVVGFGKFGLRFEKKGNQLNLIVRYPMTPNVLRSLAQINQGDISYRMSSMSSKTNTNDNKSNDRNHSSKIETLANEIFSPSKQKVFQLLNDSPIDNVAWHDFAAYQYIKKPSFLEQNDSSSVMPPVVPSDEVSELLENEGADSSEIAYYLNILGQEFSRIIEQEIGNYFQANERMLRDKRGVYIPRAYADLASSSIIDALQAEPGTFATIVEIFLSLPPEPLSRKTMFAQWLAMEFPDQFSSRGEYYEAIAIGNVYEVELYFRWMVLKHEALTVWGDDSSAPAYGDQGDMQDNAPLIYPFELYTPNTWNLGLRLVYRQEWRPLGNQRGEVIKTIPLGPKQIEKISTKIVKRTKQTRTSENLKSTETTTETSDTTKDSSEIVNEASSSFGWHAEASVYQGWSSGWAKVSGGMEGTSEDKSKNASTQLSETMQKTASKIKTETKIVVSTESESTFEMTTASEIQNPNEEIALTYVYSKLQLQYEVFTSLAEVQNVVMIAETVPAPYEINNSWVKEHDWTIAKVLLDDSFRDALASISQEVSVDEIPMDKIDVMMDNAGISLATLANKEGSASLSNVDVIQEAQRAYRESYKENLEKQRNHQLLQEKQKRLREHIRKNILHYCRAIWSQEDPEQRLLRYKRLDVKVPLYWQFVGNFGGQYQPDWTIDDLLQQVQAHETDDNGNTVFDLDGEFQDVTGSDEVDLSDLINPAGPIGYYGNYAIYYMRPEYANVDMFNMLQIVKTPYLYYEKGDPANPTLIDPSLKRLTIERQGQGPRDEEEKIEMSQYVPELRLRYAIAEKKGQNAVNDLLNDEALFKKFYPEHLFRKDQSRRFLVETNNLMIDILPGDGSALEAFKLAHRGIDVLKVAEERDKMKLENERRQKLIDEGKLGDPDIEKVTVVTGDSSQLGSLITGVVEGTTEDE